MQYYRIPRPLISCGGIVPVQGLQQQKQELFHRNFQQSFWDVAFLATLSRRSAPCHKRGPSTTLTRRAQTMLKSAKTKPQVDSLLIFEKANYG